MSRPLWPLSQVLCDRSHRTSIQLLWPLTNSAALSGPVRQEPPHSRSGRSLRSCATGATAHRFSRSGRSLRCCATGATAHRFSCSGHSPTQPLSQVLCDRSHPTAALAALSGPVRQEPPHIDSATLAAFSGAVQQTRSRPLWPLSPTPLSERFCGTGATPHRLLSGCSIDSLHIHVLFVWLFPVSVY